MVPIRFVLESFEAEIRDFNVVFRRRKDRRCMCDSPGGKNTLIALNHKELELA